MRNVREVVGFFSLSFPHQTYPGARCSRELDLAGVDGDQYGLEGVCKRVMQYRSCRSTVPNPPIAFISLRVKATVCMWVHRAL